jgi:hypothetical protein
MSDLDTVVLKVPQGTKARWVSQSYKRGGTLNEWAIDRIDGPPGPKPLAAIEDDQIIALVYLQDHIEGIETQADALAAVADGRADAIIERLLGIGPVSVVWLTSHSVEPL